MKKKRYYFDKVKESFIRTQNEAKKKYQVEKRRKSEELLIPQFWINQAGFGRFIKERFVPLFPKSQVLFQELSAKE
ncbi:hypothetical protein J6W78_00185 [bacterium]|nr:hypothetical protein [bacterium]